MKHFRILLLLGVLLVNHNVLGASGEVLFKIMEGSTHRNFTVRLNTASYFWFYNSILSKPILGDSSLFPHEYTLDRKSTRLNSSHRT